MANIHGLFLQKIKRVTGTTAFHKILDELNRKPNKIWEHKGSKFYNRSMKPFLQNNDIEMYSTGNKGKSGIAEMFMRACKKKFVNTCIQF